MSPDVTTGLVFLIYCDFKRGFGRMTGLTRSQDRLQAVSHRWREAEAH
jgi:hypothetical protein